MEKQISDRSLVDLLFKTIKEFYLKSENIVSDCKKYDRCRLIWECKIVCVNRYCMNLLYAPYWGKQR